jgi:hypothetical protein
MSKQIDVILPNTNKALAEVLKNATQRYRFLWNKKVSYNFKRVLYRYSSGFSFNSS